MTNRVIHEESSTNHRGHLDAGPLGTLEIVWTETGISSVEFLDRAPASLAPVPAHIAAPIAAYLAGAKTDPASLGIDFAGAGTPKQRKVWDALRTIPFGEVRSYRWLAREVRSIPRAVGRANGANPIPIVVPCHRIINADGTLGGFSSGLARKIFLLRLEGLTVDGTGPTARVTKGQMHFA